MHPVGPCGSYGYSRLSCRAAQSFVLNSEKAVFTAITAELPAGHIYSAGPGNNNRKNRCMIFILRYIHAGAGKVHLFFVPVTLRVPPL